MDVLKSLLLAALVVVIAGCSPSSQQRPNVTHTKNTDKKKCQGDDCSNRGTDASGEHKLVADCTDPACVLHVPTGRHYACLQTAAGRCAHFGAACSPSNDCVYDGETKKYRTCSNMQLGACLSFAGDCAPAEPCIVDPKDGLFRRCQKPIVGGCRDYGELCGPKG